MKKTAAKPTNPDPPTGAASPNNSVRPISALLNTAPRFVCATPGGAAIFAERAKGSVCCYGVAV